MGSVKERHFIDADSSNRKGTILFCVFDLWDCGFDPLLK
jgi:hypothetical protein